jgi:hypothetical protein
MPDRFYTDAVQWMVDNDITTGTTPSCFSPDDPVSRGQVAAFMWRMEGEPDPGPPHGFSDVVAAWQQHPASWMANNDITTGTSPSTYSPDDELTRGQLAALLHRLAGEPAAPPPTDFNDIVKPWQVTPVGWMVKEGITTGTTPSTFSPDDTVTRGQLATFFHRYKDTPAVTVNESSPRCERVGPFVGTWNGIDPPPDNSNVTFNIDPAGNMAGFDDFATICQNRGIPNAGATWEQLGSQSGPTTWVAPGDWELTCIPDGIPPTTFVIPGPTAALNYDPVADTITINDICHWRAGSTDADCT